MIAPEERAEWRNECRGSKLEVHIVLIRLLDALEDADARAEQTEANAEKWRRLFCPFCPASGPCDHTAEDVTCAEIIAEWAKRRAK